MTAFEVIMSKKKLIKTYFITFHCDCFRSTRHHSSSYMAQLRLANLSYMQQFHESHLVSGHAKHIMHLHYSTESCYLTPNVAHLLLSSSSCYESCLNITMNSATALGRKCMEPHYLGKANFCLSRVPSAHCKVSLSSVYC